MHVNASDQYPDMWKIAHDFKNNQTPKIPKQKTKTKTHTKKALLVVRRY
jgi:hypothetical protein